MPVTIDYHVLTDQYENRVAWLPNQGRHIIPGLAWADYYDAPDDDPDPDHESDD